MQKLEFNRPPDPFGQINTELSNIDRFLIAQTAAKSKNPIEWDTLSGIRTFSGFVGCSYSKSRRLIKTGQVPSYKIGNIYFFVLSEVIKAINEDPAIGRSNWLSYEDNQHSQDELIIHWKKYRYPDHCLVKFTYLHWSSYVILPPEFWTRNARIVKAMIREINKRNKIVPFKANPL